MKSVNRERPQHVDSATRLPAVFRRSNGECGITDGRPRLGSTSLTWAENWPASPSINESHRISRSWREAVFSDQEHQKDQTTCRSQFIGELTRSVATASRLPLPRAGSSSMSECRCSNPKRNHTTRESSRNSQSKSFLIQEFFPRFLDSSLTVHSLTPSCCHTLMRTTPGCFDTLLPRFRSTRVRAPAK